MFLTRAAEIMSTIKCPVCNLINFATTQYCKRCKTELNQLPPTQFQNQAQFQNQTQILETPNHTHFRQTPPVLHNNYNQNTPNYGQNYQSQEYEYALPQFPQGQYQPQFNPYQNPQPFQVQEIAYRKLGKEIALHRNSSLPEICVKCGQDLTAYNGGAFVLQKYRWHHPALYIALISPIIYLILSLCLSERAKIEIPLCREHINSRETAKNTLIIGGVISLILIVLSINFGWAGFGFLVFFAALIGLTAVSEYSYKPVRIKRREGSYYHLAGASDKFLDRLPF